MRATKMLARALGVEGAIIKGVRDEGDSVVVEARPPAKARKRCPVCQRRCPGYDGGVGVRRWRTHDVGLAHTYIEAEAPRVRCPEHGVLVAHMPWARHRSAFTRSFEDTVAWLAVRTDKTTLSSLMAIAWVTVGAIVARVCAPKLTDGSRFDGVTRIGIDELSYRKGHQYLTVVLDHDSGRLLWAHPERNEATLHKFFRAFGAARCKHLRPGEHPARRTRHASAGRHGRQRGSWGAPKSSDAKRRADFGWAPKRAPARAPSPA